MLQIHKLTVILLLVGPERALETTANLYVSEKNHIITTIPYQ